MKPSQVLDAQADLLSRLSNPTYHPYFKSVLGKDPQALETLRQHVSLADAYRVTEDMSDTVAFAAAKLTSEDRIDLTLAPTEWGFVRFDKPLPVLDVRGRTMLANFLTWGPVRISVTGPLGEQQYRRAFYLTWWNDLQTHPDEVAATMVQKYGENRMLTIIGRWGSVGGTAIHDGQTVGGPQVHVTDEDVLAALFGGDDLPPLSGESEVVFTNTDRYVHALWLLMGQTITDVSEERLTKKQAGRLAKARIPGRVSVIRLRRVEYGKAHGESHVEWQRRWLVRGHWRWQPCGKGRQERVRIWISPYVKGPEGAPLIVPQKVYDLAR